jgi:SAM-dependent methyltransferase
MMERPEEVGARASAMTNAVWVVTALGFLFESGLVEHLTEPRTVEELAARVAGPDAPRIAAVLAVLETEGFVGREADRWRGAPGLAAYGAGPRRAAIQGDVRGTLLQCLALLETARGATPRRGWSHTDPTILQTQGDMSGSLPGMFKTMLIPTMGDLAQRLEGEGGRFLDVGVGVAALAIGMCRAYPRLQVVGVDVHEPALALARANVVREGLDQRLELRNEAVEALRDEAAFDLAWVPSFFLRPGSLPAVVTRVRAAIKPGGWLLLAAICRGIDPEPRRGAALGLVADVVGGTAYSVDEVEGALREAGFAEVRRAPGPPMAIAFFLARRS